MNRTGTREAFWHGDAAISPPGKSQLRGSSITVSSRSCSENKGQGEARERDTQNEPKNNFVLFYVKGQGCPSSLGPSGKIGGSGLAKKRVGCLKMGGGDYRLLHAPENPTWRGWTKWGG